MAGSRILIVEDEPSYVDALEVALHREGFTTSVAVDGLEALTKFEEVQPDLVLLDLMLPRMSGIDVCRAIRMTSRTPVIMVTAKDSELDTVVGLEVGADDYVTKPYGLHELIARIRAVLRRTAGPVNELDADILRLGEIELSRARREVTVRTDIVAMARKEFELLDLLMSNAGRVVTRQSLIHQVWGPHFVGDAKTLDVHVKRLRAKVEQDPKHPTYITTLRGVGYRFDAHEEPRT